MEVVFDPNSGATPPPVRRLKDGPDFRPDWRFLTMEYYLGQIAKADNRSAETQRIISTEKDGFVRQLLRFQCNRTCVITGPINYAVRCHVNNPQHRLAAAIKAMVIAGRTAEQIAQEIGTDRWNVIVYEKIFFDVRHHEHNTAWLAQLCRPIKPNCTDAELCEARWLQVAYARGWAGVAPLLTRPRQLSLATGESGLNQLVQHLIFRARDFVANLDMIGTPPSERDLELLALLQPRLQQVGLPTAPGAPQVYDLSDAEDFKRRAEAEELVKGVSAASRRKLMDFIQRITSRTAEEVSQIPAG